MVTVVENGHATRVQILNKAVCISHSTNTFGEKYETHYSPFGYVQIVWLTGFFNLGMTTSL